MKTTVFYSFLIAFTFIMIIACNKDENNEALQVTDIDGNIYNTVEIGTQVWMVENLKTTRYRNGDPVPNITDSAGWCGLSAGAYCNYDNNINYADNYGRLYNWFAVIDSRNIAPDGWHVPTDEEWTILTDYLGGRSEAGGKMKEIGTIHWDDPNTGATNSSGFTAIPGGHRNHSDATFRNSGSDAVWWSTTESGLADNSWCRIITNGSEGVNRNGSYQGAGLSIRCVKD